MPDNDHADGPGKTAIQDQQEAPDGGQDGPDAADLLDGDEEGSVVAVRERGEDETEVDYDESIEHPTRLLRIAHMIRSLLDEVRTTDVDEAGRERLRDIHNEALESLGEIVSDELEEELSDISPKLHDGTPTGDELRIVQAQLAGWLEGLFRGIQASMASQQRALQQQLQQARRGKQGQPPGSGQYL